MAIVLLNPKCSVLCFEDHCLTLCPFSLTFVVSVLRFTACD